MKKTFIALLCSASLFVTSSAEKEEIWLAPVLSTRDILGLRGGGGISESISVSGSIGGICYSSKVDLVEENSDFFSFSQRAKIGEVKARVALLSAGVYVDYFPSSKSDLFISTGVVYNGSYAKDRKTEIHKFHVSYKRKVSPFLGIGFRGENFYTSFGFSLHGGTKWTSDTLELLSPILGENEVESPRVLGLTKHNFVLEGLLGFHITF